MSKPLGPHFFFNRIRVRCSKKMSRGSFHGQMVVVPAVLETIHQPRTCSITIVEELTIDVRGWVAVSFHMGQAEGGAEAVDLKVFRGSRNHIHNVTLRFCSSAIVIAKGRVISNCHIHDPECRTLVLAMLWMCLGNEPQQVDVVMVEHVNDDLRDGLGGLLQNFKDSAWTELDQLCDLGGLLNKAECHARELEGSGDGGAGGLKALADFLHERAKGRSPGVDGVAYKCGDPLKEKFRDTCIIFMCRVVGRLGE